MARWFRQLPNLLTFFRIALIPVMVFLLLREQSFAALIIFTIAALTDLIDGIVARRFGLVSNLGKLMDPMADKILVMAALVALVSLRTELTAEPWTPGWMVILVLAREIWVTGLRAVAASSGNVVAASSIGKLKSLIQMVAVGFLIYHNPVTIYGYRVYSQLVGEMLLLSSIFFSYWGAWDYTRSILSDQKFD